MTQQNQPNHKLKDQLAFLKQVSLFANLNTEDLTLLATDFRAKTYGKNEIVFHQGDNSHSLYIVMKGKVRIFKTSPAGGETTINLFSIHNIIGEFAIIDQQPRSATAKAITKCVLLSITQDKFLHHLRTIPDLSLEMCQLLVKKARWTASYAESVAQYDTAGRLLHILLLYNDQFGEAIEPGKKYKLDLGLNQTDLASLVGVRREWVNHILQHWRKRQLIEYKTGQITILDLERVKAERDNRIETNVTSW